jgi:hypothetical protein
MKAYGSLEAVAAAELPALAAVGGLSEGTARALRAAAALALEDRRAAGQRLKAPGDTAAAEALADLAGDPGLSAAETEPPYGE